MEQIQQIQSIVTSMKFIDVTTVQKNCEKYEREMEKAERERDLIVQAIGKQEYEKITKREFSEYQAVNTNEEQFDIAENLQEIENQIRIVYGKLTNLKQCEEDEQDFQNDLQSLKQELKTVQDDMGKENYYNTIREQKRKKKHKRTYHYFSRNDKKRKMRRVNEGDFIIDESHYNQLGRTKYQVKRFKELECCFSDTE